MYTKRPRYQLELVIGSLTFLLATQFIHTSRETLATHSFFYSTIAPIYRALGAPIAPRWNIKAWQFAGTSGRVDADETELTIVSSIVSRSDKTLPYPLVLVSLTNRFEEIIGSRIVTPNEYLASDLDATQPVEPGQTFTAVITIEEPSRETTGFKLNVCYEVHTEAARCAIEDFRN